MANEREQSVNSYTFTYLCSFICYNKTANIVEKLLFIHVLTADVLTDASKTAKMIKR